MSILGAKNKVIAGDYTNAKIMMVNGLVTLSSPSKMIILNKKMVAAHAVESEVKGNHKVAITFSDGKKSLLEMDDKMCKALLAQLF